MDSIREGEGISHMKLQKLMYYAQGFHLAIYDEPLFKNQIRAWMHGPVLPSLYYELKPNGRNNIQYKDDFNSSKLTEEEYDLVEEVYDVFGKFSAWKLRCMTHSESCWKNHEYHGEVIPQDEMKEYFKTRLR